MDTATSQVDTQETNASEESEIKSLLSGDGTTDGKGTAGAVEAEEPPADTETLEVEEEDRGTTTDDEPAEEAEESEEAAEEEESADLSIEDSDRDYSEAAYKKAADHYSKTHKIQLDPNDPAHRALLKEAMDRGEALKASKAEIERLKAAEPDEEEAATEEQAPATEANRAEAVKKAITELQTFAKTRVVPEVANHIATRFSTALSALIDKESGEWKVTPEAANNFAEVFTEMGYHLLNDALPFILDKTFGTLSQDPIMSRMTTMATREGAFDFLDGLKDKAGQPLYPDLERMVDKGDIQRALKANPWIAKSTFDEKDPIKREARRIEAAYKIARGESIDPATVGKAVQTGKKQAEAAARAKAAARVAPGKTKGPIGQQPSENDQFVEKLTSGPGYGSRLSKLLADGKDK